MPPVLPTIAITTAKQDRLRQAKAEAEKEINAYKAEREMAYQKKIAEVRRAEDEPRERWRWCHQLSSSGHRAAQEGIGCLLQGAAAAGVRPHQGDSRFRGGWPRQCDTAPCQPPDTPAVTPLLVCQGTAGSANNVKRLQTETDAAILKTHSDVTARKGQVRLTCQRCSPQPSAKPANLRSATHTAPFPNALSVCMLPLPPGRRYAGQLC